MADRFEVRRDMPYFPPRSHSAVTLSTASFNPILKSIYVGTAGDLKIKMVGTTALVDYVNIPSGTEISGRIEKVQSSGITANDAANVVARW